MSCNVPRHIDADTLAALLTGTDEVALFDVREESVIRRAHIFHAAYLPLSWTKSRWERVRALVPRYDTTVVLMGGSGSDEPEVEAEAARWTAWGYTDVHVLRGGLRAWIAGGRRAYRHVTAPSKALAEAAREVYAVPIWAPADLVHAQESARASNLPAPLVVDVRSEQEYGRATLPGAVGIPGGELLARLPSLLDSDDDVRPVVITCAFRTRGLFGALSARWWDRLQNPVYFLEGGTQAWLEAGQRLEPGVSPVGKSAPLAPIELESHPAAAAIQRVDCEGLDAMLTESGRTTYVIDPRLEAGPTRGLSPLASARIRHVPGGQYVEAIDEYTPVYRSRVVLVDEAPYTRALALARWLHASRLVDVYVYVYEETGRRTASLGAASAQIVPHSSIPPPDEADERDERDAGAVLDPDAGLMPDYTAWSRALPAMARAELGGFAFAHQVRKAIGR